MIEERYVPVGSYRPLYPALAPDNGIPAADIKGNTGPWAKFERSRYRQSSPEMRVSGNNKIAVNLHVPFEIRSFLSVKGIALL